MFKIPMIHNDWYHDGLEDGEDLWRLDFEVPAYPHWLQAQLFATPVGYTKENRHEPPWDRDPTEFDWSHARLLIERDGRDDSGDVRIDYAFAVWPLTPERARELLAASTEEAVGMMSNEIAQVLSLPCDTSYCDMTKKTYDLDNSVDQTPEIVALRLATIYGDGSTTLVSLTHRVIICDFEGDCTHIGIPHLYLDGKIERLASEAYWGEKYDGDFPGWPAIFAYIERWPQLLDEKASDEGMPWSEDEL
jgi:hypothetical protein